MQSYKSSQGVEVPKMLYGTAWKKEQTAELVLKAIHAGFTGVDTACQPKHYQEDLVGEGIAAALKAGVTTREALYIQTKFTPIEGQDPNKVPYDPTLPIAQQVESSVQRSLENLQTDYLDGLLIHSAIFPFSKMMQVYRTFETFVEQGLVRHIGISNCYELPVLQRLFEEASIKPSVIQNRFYRDSDYDTTIRSFCDEVGMLYQSFWSLTANGHILQSQTMFNLCRKYQRSEAEIFYRFLLHLGMTVLNGTTDERHMRDDLLIESFALEPEEIATLRAMLI